MRSIIVNDSPAPYECNSQQDCENVAGLAIISCRRLVDRAISSVTVWHAAAAAAASSAAAAASETQHDSDGAGGRGHTRGVGSPGLAWGWLQGTLPQGKARHGTARHGTARAFNRHTIIINI